MNKDEARAIFDRLDEAGLKVSLEKHQGIDSKLQEPEYTVEVQISSPTGTDQLRLIADQAERHGCTVHPGAWVLVLR